MKYYILTGEASGDFHGSNLMRALLQHDPEAHIRYWGGDQMQHVAGALVRHIRDLAYMGFAEVVTHLPAVLGNIRQCQRDIRDFAPDVLVTIDYPGFNLRMARYAHSLGIPTVHYISPQLWAWKKGRLRSMRRTLDHLCYILPFEQAFYQRHPLAGATYVGHPLLDAVGQYAAAEKAHPNSPATDPAAATPNPAADPALAIPQATPVVALLPGSRRQELCRLLPLFLAVAQRHPELRFRVAAMRLIGEDYYRALAPQGWPANVELTFDGTYPLLAQADVALVCSGTATLEAALFRVPQVVCYRTSALSVAIARRLVGRRIRYISLPNLIADRAIVTELIQQDCSLHRLDQELQRLLRPAERQAMQRDYDTLITTLGGPGASQRTAAVVIQAARSHTPAQAAPQPHAPNQQPQ